MNGSICHILSCCSALPCSHRYFYARIHIQGATCAALSTNQVVNSQIQAIITKVFQARFKQFNNTFSPVAQQFACADGTNVSAAFAVCSRNPFISSSDGWMMQLPTAESLCLNSKTVMLLLLRALQPRACQLYLCSRGCLPRGFYVCFANGSLRRMSRQPPDSMSLSPQFSCYTAQIKDVSHHMMLCAYDSAPPADITWLCDCNVQGDAYIGFRLGYLGPFPDAQTQVRLLMIDATVIDAFAYCRVASHGTEQPVHLCM